MKINTCIQCATRWSHKYNIIHKYIISKKGKIQMSCIKRYRIACKLNQCMKKLSLRIVYKSHEYSSNQRKVPINYKLAISISLNIQSPYDTKLTLDGTYRLRSSLVMGVSCKHGTWIFSRQGQRFWLQLNSEYHVIVLARVSWSNVSQSIIVTA